MIAVRSQSPMARMQATHAITRALDAKAVIRPLGIFVARRNAFDVEAERHIGSESIRRWLFAELPLFEHGWDDASATIFLVREGASRRLWRVERK